MKDGLVDGDPSGWMQAGRSVEWMNHFVKCVEMSTHQKLRTELSASYPMGTRGSFPGGKAAGA